jgi:hypothetical protein
VAGDAKRGDSGTTAAGDGGGGSQGGATLRATAAKAVQRRALHQGGVGRHGPGNAAWSPSLRRRRAMAAQAAWRRALHRGGAVVRGGRGSVVVQGSPDAAAVVPISFILPARTKTRHHPIWLSYA